MGNSKDLIADSIIRKTEYSPALLGEKANSPGPDRKRKLKTLKIVMTISRRSFEMNALFQVDLANWQATCGNHAKPQP